MNTKVPVTILSVAILGAFLMQAQANASPRNHMRYCNNNKHCAEEQHRAKLMWDSQQWDGDIKNACKRQYLNSNSEMTRNYVGAVNCVYSLQDLANMRTILQNNGYIVTRKH